MFGHSVYYRLLALEEHKIAMNLQKKIVDTQPNKKVKENRLIFKILIDIVTFLGTQEYTFSIHNETED